MTHALLVGAFGQGNPGDEALCAAFCRALHGADVTIASRTPALTAARYHADAVTTSPIQVLRSLRATDLVVAGGGTVFKQLHPSTGRPRNALLRSTAALVGLAHARGAVVALVGVGAGPLSGREARVLTRWIVRHTDLLVLRDEESAAVLTEVGAATPFRVGADPAWTLLGAPEPRAAEGIGRAGSITVAVSHLAGDRSLVERLGEALRPFAATRPVRLEPWQTDGGRLDHAVAEALAARIGAGAQVADPPADLAAARDGYRGDRLVIALRFHALVAAGAAGTTALAIAHEPKLGGLARRLEQPSAPPHATTEVLRRAIGEALEHPPAPAATVAGEIARAAEGMDLMRLLLTRGEVEEPAAIHSPPLSTGVGWW
jgi:polysaccharide pyruvyl transferase WcaK-like protein